MNLNRTENDNDFPGQKLEPIDGSFLEVKNETNDSVFVGDFRSGFM